MKRKNPAAVALGRLGGKAKAAKLTAEQRSENARKAGLAGGRGRAKKLLVDPTPEESKIENEDRLEALKRFWKANGYKV